MRISRSLSCAAQGGYFRCTKVLTERNELNALCDVEFRLFCHVVSEESQLDQKIVQKIRSEIVDYLQSNFHFLCWMAYQKFLCSEISLPFALFYLVFYFPFLWGNDRRPNYKWWAVSLSVSLLILEKRTYCQSTVIPTGCFRHIYFLSHAYIQPPFLDVAYRIRKRALLFKILFQSCYTVKRNIWDGFLETAGKRKCLEIVFWIDGK